MMTGIQLRKLYKPLGWILILISVGPLGLTFGLITTPSLAGLTFIGIFALVFAIGIWLIRQPREEVNNVRRQRDE